MKKYILLSLVTFSTFFAVGQKALTFQAAESDGILVSELDSIYKSGIHSNPDLAMFAGQTEEYIEAYHQLLTDLGKHLRSFGFVWKSPVKAFNRIYFNKDGGIDYFLYTFRPGQLTNEEELRFATLLDLFIKQYHFKLEAPGGFSQCSPVTYIPD